MEREWVRFIHAMTVVARHDVILVARPCAGLWYESLPNARMAVRMERVGSAVPVIEVANDADVFRIGRPHGELSSLNAFERHRVRTEFLI